eukprot:gene25089-30615_t
MSDGEYVVVDLENNSTVESGSQDTAKNVRPRKRKRKLKNKPPPARKNSEHEEEEVEEEDGDAPEGQRFRSGTVTRRLKKPMSVYFEQANVQLLENQGRVTLKVVRSDPLNRVTKIHVLVFDSEGEKAEMDRRFVVHLERHRVGIPVGKRPSVEVSIFADRNKDHAAKILQSIPFQGVLTLSTGFALFGNDLAIIYGDK